MQKSQGALMKRQASAFLLVILLGLAGPANPATAGTLSPADVAAIRRVHKQYEVAWLKGDADGVRALFTDDCVLFPPHASVPRVGKKGLNEFWFPPDAPPSTVTKLVITIESIGG